MTRYILDTNVVSETSRPRPHVNVLQFLEGEVDLAISAVTLHELRYGAAIVRDAPRREALATWVDAVAARFADRLVPIDARMAETAASLRAHAQRRGFAVEGLDALIAACAVETGAVLATRNVADFEPLGIALLNPWD